MTTASARPHLSVIIGLGPPHDELPVGVRSAHAAVCRRTDTELVIVEDWVSPGLRTRLGTLDGPVRIRHNSRTLLGRRLAAVVGAVTAHGSILVLVDPEARIEDAHLTAIARAFDDPSLQLAEAVRSDGTTALIALRAAQLAALGGPAVLELGEGDASAGAIIPAGLLQKVLGSDARVTTLPPITGGTAPHWAGAAERAHALARPLWEPIVTEDCPRHGVNVVGLLEAVCGTADLGRRYVDAFEHASVPIATYAYHGHSSPMCDYDHRGPRTLPYDTNLIVFNPELLPNLALDAGLELWHTRYTIGAWAWEFDVLGDTQREGFRFVNEVWVSTNFVRDAYASSGEREVRTIPLAVRERDGAPPHDRRALGLDERAYLFLTMFDFGSIAMRKNSIGAIQAFTRAFSPGSGPMLIVKTLNGNLDPHGLARLHEAIGDRRDILVIDGLLPEDVVTSLIANVDCVVSLHRSEGFGLTMSEAMAWGLPVIATGYSGNMQFMNDENSYLVGYDLVEVPESLTSIFPRGARWAEPHLDEAAAHMRAVFEHPEIARARGELGRADIRRTNSVEATASAVAARLGELAELRARAVAQRQPGRPRPPQRRRPPVGARRRS